MENLEKIRIKDLARWAKNTEEAPDARTITAGLQKLGITVEAQKVQLAEIFDFLRSSWQELDRRKKTKGESSPDPDYYEPTTDDFSLNGIIHRTDPVRYVQYSQGVQLYLKNAEKSRELVPASEVKIQFSAVLRQIILNLERFKAEVEEKTESPELIAIAEKMVRACREDLTSDLQTFASIMKREELERANRLESLSEEKAKELVETLGIEEEEAEDPEY